MFKKLTLTLMILTLSGCSTVFQTVANYYDSNDICQSREFADDGTRLKPHGYRPSANCGGGRTTMAVIRDNNYRQIGVVTNR